MQRTFLMRKESRTPLRPNATSWVVAVGYYYLSGSAPSLVVGGVRHGGGLDVLALHPLVDDAQLALGHAPATTTPSTYKNDLDKFD